MAGYANLYALSGMKKSGTPTMRVKISQNAMHKGKKSESENRNSLRLFANISKGASRQMTTANAKEVSKTGRSRFLRFFIILIKSISPNTGIKAPLRVCYRAEKGRFVFGCRGYKRLEKAVSKHTYDIT